MRALSLAWILFALACPSIGQSLFDAQRGFMSETEAGPETIYEHFFTGSSTQNLNGVAVDVTTGSSATWTATTPHFKADGSVSVINTAEARLLFTPVSGYVYRWEGTVSVNGTGLQNDYALIGYQTNSTTLFTGFGPFVLFRDNLAASDVLRTWSGFGLAGPVDVNPNPDPVDPTDLMISLDTRTADWVAVWHLDGLPIRTNTYASAEAAGGSLTQIYYVKIASTGVPAKWDYIKLTRGTE